MGSEEAKKKEYFELAFFSAGGKADIGGVEHKQIHKQDERSQQTSLLQDTPLYLNILNISPLFEFMPLRMTMCTVVHRCMIVFLP